MKDMPRLISLGVLLVLIVALGSTFYRVLAPFFIPLLLAAMTAILVQPVFRYFLKKFPANLPVAAGLTTGALLAAIMIPLMTITILSSLQLYSFAADTDAKSIERALEKGVELFNHYRAEDEQITAAEASQKISEWFKSLLTDIGDKSMGTAAGSTLGAVTGVFGFFATLAISLLIYGMALYFFLADGAQFLSTTKSLIPVDTTYQEELVAEFCKVVQGVVIATFLAALGQGLATVAALGFLGFHNLFALGALATFSALIPLLGTWIVWVPCAIWLFTHQRVTEGVILSAYCILFVGFIDNIIRTYVLNSNVKLHPLLAFISVLGGIQALGLWGVFIGPIIACCLYALIKIFNTELKEMSLERNGAGTAKSAVPVGDFPVVAAAAPAAVQDTPKPETK